MAAYKLIRVTKTSENENGAGYDFDVLDTAVTQMHNYFGIEVNKETSTGVLCVLVDNTTGKTDKLQWGEAVKDRVYAHNDYTSDQVYTYDDEKTAIGNFHTRVAAQRLNANCNEELTIRFDGVGNAKEFDKWTRPVEEEEPVEE